MSAKANMAAIINLNNLNTEAKGFEQNDFLIWLLENGVPQEIVMRLEELWNFTQKIGKKCYSIGKIIALRICAFAEKHKEFSKVIAIAVACSVIIEFVPYLGWLLAPIVQFCALWIGLPLAVFFDLKEKKGKTIRKIKILAMDFFEIFKHISNDINSKQGE